MEDHTGPFYKDAFLQRAHFRFHVILGDYIPETLCTPVYPQMSHRQQLHIRKYARMSHGSSIPGKVAGHPETIPPTYPRRICSLLCEATKDPERVTPPIRNGFWPKPNPCRATG